MSETTCPCRLRAEDQKPYSACCAPYLEAGKPAPTAEALMRARYSAFALGKIDFLLDSLAPESRYDFDRKAVAHWSSQSQWQGLDIISAEQGQAGDKQGFVEFVAHFVMDGETRAHRERSLFRFDEADGRWYFVEEANRKPAPIVKGDQPGRNDPCPCGSGKKYKKCCGAAA
ncbi:MAG: YchJ family protein [Methylocystis sp.]|jgi:SEC-C motif-containing protein